MSYLWGMWALTNHQATRQTELLVKTYVNMFLAKTICEKTFSASITSNTRSLFPEVGLGEQLLRYL